MKLKSFPPGMRALIAFAGTVLLALVAVVSLLAPEITVQSADSLPHLANGIGQMLSAGL